MNGGDNNSRLAFFIFVSVSITVFLIYYLAHFFELKQPNQITITEYTAIPLLIITLIQFERTLRQRQANFVKDYISQFFLNKDLHVSFQYLIQDFTRSKWEMVEKIAIEHEEKLKKNPDYIWELLREINTNREEGKRYYHPKYFQGSKEEMNLDSMLGFFDVIGYHHHKKLLSIEDITSSIGYYLRAIKSNHAIEEYMYLISTNWKNKKKYQEAYGERQPFYYLKALLEAMEINDLKKACKKQNILQKIWLCIKN